MTAKVDSQNAQLAELAAQIAAVPFTSAELELIDDPFPQLKRFRPRFGFR